MSESIEINYKINLLFVFEYTRELATGHALSDTVECQIIYRWKNRERKRWTNVVVRRLIVCRFWCRTHTHIGPLINALEMRERERAKSRVTSVQHVLKHHLVRQIRWCDESKTDRNRNWIWIDKIEEAATGTRYRFFCGHRNDIEKCNADNTRTQKDTKQHQQHQSTNPLECTFIIFASHFSSAIYRCDRSTDAGKCYIVRESRCTWTVKSLIGYLILELKKRMLKWCSSSSSSNRECSRDWNTNFSMHSSHFNYSFMNGMVLGWMTQHSTITILCHSLAKAILHKQARKAKSNLMRLNECWWWWRDAPPGYDLFSSLSLSQQWRISIAKSTIHFACPTRIVRNAKGHSHITCDVRVQFHNNSSKCYFRFRSIIGRKWIYEEKLQRANFFFTLLRQSDINYLSV